VKKIKPDGSKTIYPSITLRASVGGIYEVDKTSGGSVTRTVTYYPVAGAMRINSTLYYVLKDHLGSASVVTDASGNVLGEQRYYPFGETRLTTGTIYTDRLFTGQREMAGLGIYHFNARFYSPKLGRFLSPDTIVPGYANPQNLNRMSYVTNNPLRYTDPTGHMRVEEGGGKRGCSDPKYCDNGKPKSRQELAAMRAPKKAKGSDTAISSSGPHIGEPTDAGDYITGYNGGGGGLSQNGISSVGGDGECVSVVCSFSGGSVPLRYGASYDVLLYDNLMVVTLHENYWIPGRDVPLMENTTFGGSTLVSQLSNGQQVETSLGNFVPGSVAYPDRLTRRDTTIHFSGSENFATQLVIRLTFGAENRGANTVYYQLPYELP